MSRELPLLAAAESNAASDALLRRRSTIAAHLASLIKDWAKYSAQYAADPAGFAELECGSLVDYMARLLATGDENYRQLYIGEKAKQFYDPLVPAAERHARNLKVLAGERAIFLREMARSPAGSALVELAFDAIDHALTAAAPVEVRALFIGDCLFLDVISFMTASALEDGIRLAPSFVTTHDPRDIKAQVAALSKERFDVVFYSPFTYAFISSYEALHHARLLIRPGDALSNVGLAVEAATEIFDVIADLFDCPIVVHAPAPLLRSEGTFRDRVRKALTAPLRHLATRRLSSALKQRGAERNASGRAVHIVDERQVASPEGLAAAGRYFLKSRLQHPAVFGAMLAPVYRDIVLVVGRLLKRKLVACDLDNTLWQGVVGEGHGVVHHYDRQAPLLDLKARGVVLTINSKNDPEKAIWTAPPGKLSLDDFLSRQINWDPKALNMRRTSEHLNLKVKDFVFIDDRADERALVSEAFPEILTLDALDPRSWRLMQLWANLLPTKPDADRTDFYRQRDARQAFISAEVAADASEREAALAKLGLRIAIREARPVDFDRATELINRTNQFNTTGGRISRQQLAEFATGADSRVLVAEAADRFGAMGTISVIILKRDGDRVAVPFFVLSCRVFGYGMELAILEHARRLVRPGEVMSGKVMKNDLNQPCHSIYADAGFEQEVDDWVLRQADKASIPIRPWLQVEADMPLPMG